MGSCARCCVTSQSFCAPSEYELFKRRLKAGLNDAFWYGYVQEATKSLRTLPNIHSCFAYMHKERTCRAVP